MITNGILILWVCVIMRLVKRFLPVGVIWALLSITYFIGVHVGVLMIVAGLLWRWL